MRRASRQHGMSTLGLLAVLALGGFFVILGLKLAPIYMEHYKVRASLKSLQEERNTAITSPQQAMEMLGRRLDVNAVRSIGRQDITITRQGSHLLVEIDYEVRRPWIGNIDLVVDFSERVEVPLR